ncbi:MAG: hypothetical protein IMZ57_02500 [Acidobacteria bacterium]|nr:hypothetical protein [Acidobacteriota bacterium]
MPLRASQPRRAAVVSRTFGVSANRDVSPPENDEPPNLKVSKLMKS